MTRVFYATDLHGCEKCWKKFINAGQHYKANILILGGDMTGKRIVPIIQRGSDFEAMFEGKKWSYSAEKVGELEDIIRSKGYYVYRTTLEEVEGLKSDEAKKDKLFHDLVCDTMHRWMKFADERLKDTNIKCFVAPGNDDMDYIEPIIQESKCVINAGDKVVMVDDYHEMISLGWTNPTPWHTFKECSEEELSKKIENLVSQIKNMENSIFNLHAPPYGSGLDEAPKIDESLKQASRIMLSVGSTAVRNVIEKYKPLLGLFGHIHEGRGFVNIGRTICINPASAYDRGILLGAIINLDEKKVKSFLPVTG